ncbi:zinc finger domain-containing protein [Archangium sp.]|uniref:zinc finger domain-containing protein n=1 Tax=Archangium sp. TaxID=1872627 RepID=UPI00389AB64D
MPPKKTKTSHQNPAASVNKYKAAALVRMSPQLLEWFSTHAPKSGHSRKLEYTKGADGDLLFEPEKLKNFSAYLAEPWPAKPGKRPDVPTGVEQEIKEEAAFKCVICDRPGGQFAHIDPVHNSKNNHPHNLIYLCPNDHDDFDKKKLISRSDIEKAKKQILDARAAIWRAHAGLLDEILALIKQLQSVNAALKKKHLPAVANIRSALMEHIKTHALAPSLKKKAPEFAKRLKSALDDETAPVERVISERAKFLDETGRAECPLCKGSGEHNNWECPVCRGVGTVSEELVNEIDLEPYRQEECPLCKGSGEHNNWGCPICRGVGTVDACAIDEIDLREYKQAKCPLCKGSGEHNNRECRFCRGIGTVDVAALEHFDPHEYEQADCPLCKGSREHNNWECSFCRGAGTVDVDALEHFDPREYKQAKCPLCKGSREHNDWECKFCRGVGTVDVDALEHFDPADWANEDSDG